MACGLWAARVSHISTIGLSHGPGTGGAGCVFASAVTNCACHVPCVRCSSTRARRPRGPSTFHRPPLRLSDGTGLSELAGVTVLMARFHLVLPFLLICPPFHFSKPNITRVSHSLEIWLANLYCLLLAGSNGVDTPLLFGVESLQVTTYCHTIIARKQKSLNEAQLKGANPKRLALRGRDFISIPGEACKQSRKAKSNKTK